MSFNYSTEYTNMNTPGSTYPYGQAINESAPGSLDGTPFERKWMNDLLGMWQRMLTLSNITPSGSAENATLGNSQYIQALAGMVLPKEFTHEDDSSVADAYIIKQTGATPELPTLNAQNDGIILAFNLPLGIENTGASTLVVDGAAPLNFVAQDGNAFSGGEVQAGKNRVKYNHGATRFELQSFVGDFPQGHISGLNISNNISSPETVLDISAGTARNIGNVFNMVSSAAIGKEIDNNWVAGGTPGAAVGGFPSAETLNADEWYRVFLIAKADGTIDSGFDASGNDDASSLLADATDFIYYRQIGWVYYQAPGEITPFKQTDDLFEYVAAFSDDPGVNQTVAAGDTVVVTAPPSTIANMVISFFNQNPASNNTEYFKVRFWDNTPAVAAAGDFDLISGRETTDFVYGQSSSISILVSPSSQILVSASNTGINAERGVQTRGFTYSRGK
ncbi:MAG: hypothetical protein ACTSQA_07285 [Candidatus Heimdallarchaeaceae archaeon]